MFRHILLLFFVRAALCVLGDRDFDTQSMTLKTREALSESIQSAKARGNAETSIWHLVAVLFSNSESLGSRLAKKVDADDKLILR